MISVSGPSISSSRKPQSFPIQTLVGHTKSLSIWRRGDESLLVMNGRFHLYQGYTAQEVTAPIRMAALLGAEVLLAHLDGNVDRPIIVGSVPNPDTQSPVTDTNATQSIIQTRGSISIVMDDDVT